MIIARGNDDSNNLTLCQCDTRDNSIGLFFEFTKKKKVFSLKPTQLNLAVVVQPYQSLEKVGPFSTGKQNF